MDLLTGYGNGSDSEENGDDFFKTPTEEEPEEVAEKVKTTEKSHPDTSKSFFFDSNEPGTSDEDDNNQDEEDVYDPKKLERKRKATTELERDFESKIFDNDFSREERINMKTLSKHVKLSEKPATNAPKKSKFTCKAYLKGKCRFGDRCRFAHPVHDRSSDSVDQVTISEGASLYTETPEAQVFHSKKFKSSAGQ